MRMEKKTERPAMERLSASTGQDIAHPLRDSERADKRSRHTVRNVAHRMRKAHDKRRDVTPLDAANRHAIAVPVTNRASPRERRRRTRVG